MLIKRISTCMQHRIYLERNCFLPQLHRSLLDIERKKKSLSQNTNNSPYKHCVTGPHKKTLLVSKNWDVVYSLDVFFLVFRPRWLDIQFSHELMKKAHFNQRCVKNLTLKWKQIKILYVGKVRSFPNVQKTFYFELNLSSNCEKQNK